jgi:hypothetical protein
MPDDAPAYLNRTQLCAHLGISDRTGTLEEWIAKGFPKAGRHGRWSRAKVDAYMDDTEDKAVPSPAPDDKGERVYNASKNFRFRHVL